MGSARQVGRLVAALFQSSLTPALCNRPWHDGFACVAEEAGAVADRDASPSTVSRVKVGVQQCPICHADRGADEAAFPQFRFMKAASLTALWPSRRGNFTRRDAAL
jgi:hypothetical protein